ncbi:MAG: thioredoxin [Dehalococcoidia bacterium]|nr:MAG: thioredoxin [Dehalococcoidia bacterium]
MITEVVSQDFDEEVLNSDIPVFACFTTSQCGSCFALCLVVEDLTKQYEGRVKFVRIDVEKEPELAAMYNILPLPAMLVFRDSEPIERVLGFKYKGSLRDLLDSVIAGSEQIT